MLADALLVRRHWRQRFRIPPAGLLPASVVLLAIGAAMIVPATLAVGIRATFCEEKHRNMALAPAAVGLGDGVWAAYRRVILLEHFY